MEGDGGSPPDVGLAKCPTAAPSPREPFSPLGHPILRNQSAGTIPCTPAPILGTSLRHLLPGLPCWLGQQGWYQVANAHLAHPLPQLAPEPSKPRPPPPVQRLHASCRPPGHQDPSPRLSAPYTRLRVPMGAVSRPAGQPQAPRTPAPLHRLPTPLGTGRKASRCPGTPRPRQPPPAPPRLTAPPGGPPPTPTAPPAGPVPQDPPAPRKAAAPGPAPRSTRLRLPSEPRVQPAPLPAFLGPG
jgi:hypothetical protein